MPEPILLDGGSISKGGYGREWMHLRPASGSYKTSYIGIWYWAIAGREFVCSFNADPNDMELTRKNKNEAHESLYAYVLKSLPKPKKVATTNPGCVIKGGTVMLPAAPEGGQT